jgi:transketolase C-terminal domain/subunit
VFACRLIGKLWGRLLVVAVMVKLAKHSGLRLFSQDYSVLFFQIEMVERLLIGAAGGIYVD